MQTAIPTDTASKSLSDRLRENGAILGAFIALLALPFIVALLDNQSFSDMMANETGNAPFVQGLLLEIFVLAIYDISNTLLQGITGLLSFGHAMFFAVGNDWPENSIGYEIPIVPDFHKNGLKRDFHQMLPARAGH